MTYKIKTSVGIKRKISSGDGRKKADWSTMR